MKTYASKPNPVSRVLENGRAFVQYSTIANILQASREKSFPELVQRKPSDFNNCTALDLSPKTGIFRTSHWEPLQTELNKYRGLNDAEFKERKATLFRLNIHKQRWLKAREQSGRLPNEQEQAKFDAITELNTLITNEYTELGKSDGNLVCPIVAPADAKSPELTDKRTESDGRKRGIALKQAEIKDATKKRLGSVTKDSLCRITEPSIPGFTNYYKVRPAPSEDRRIGHVATFPEGYVLKADIADLSLEKPAKGAKYEDVADPALFPLFPGPPCVEDVQQAYLGDCYLLTAIMAIVRNNPQHFVDSMKDHGNGGVSVRLYEIIDGPPKTFQQVIIPVKKSIVVNSSASTTVDRTYNNNVLWVEMIEKAYAAAKFSGTRASTLPLLTTSWTQLESGTGQIALEHLLGRETNTHEVQTREIRNADTWLTRGFFAYYNSVDKTSTVPEKYNKLQPLEQELLRLEKSKDEVRKGDVLPLINNFVADVQLKGMIQTYLQNNQIYPEKRGQGKYTQDQIAIFSTIATAITTHKIIIASSKKSMKRNDSNRAGISAGEHVHKGLAGPHGYEVFELSPLTNPPVAGEVLWLHLRNPWGETGRQYKDKITGQVIVHGTTQPFDAHAEKTSMAEFWITLEDFTKRFSNITIV